MLVLAAFGHAAAPAARAECDGGYTYEVTVRHAHGALIGVITATDQDDMGFVYASAIDVERAYGVTVGRVYRDRVDVGLCGEDAPLVGARVVVLLDVRMPGVAGGPWNVLYTIGQTVTRSQAASLAADLPDTSTVSSAAALAGTADRKPSSGLVEFAAFAALVGLLLRWLPIRPVGPPPGGRLR